jgi:hypothetical protein
MFEGFIPVIVMAFGAAVYFFIKITKTANQVFPDPPILASCSLPLYSTGISQPCRSGNSPEAMPKNCTGAFP